MPCSEYLDNRRYRAIIGKPESYQRSLKIVWYYGNNEVWLAGLKDLLGEIIRQVTAIKRFSCSDDGYTIFLIFEDSLASVDEALGKFLRIIKKRFVMKELVIQCEECFRIEQMVKEIAEQFEINLETFETKKIEK